MIPSSLHYLAFDLSDNTEGVHTLEAMASTPAERHAAVLAEVDKVLAWAWREYPDAHGPADEGMAWDHDLQVHVEPGGWHTVTLTITASQTFAEDFMAAFGTEAD